MQTTWRSDTRPTDPLTIVPLAITLATLMQSAESAILLASNIGGDSDSVASVAGSNLGARYRGSVNEDWYRTVETVNHHRLIRFGEDLSALRS
jgi:ADP-ribosylglycohydrolase